MLYEAADTFFIIFHTTIILFNLFGWLWKSIRRWNFILLVLTGLSWTVLGIWYGIGYCPCTDWHWDVLRELERTPVTDSYIEYLAERLTGMEVASTTADVVTVVTYFFLLLISGYLNWRDWRSQRWL